tara:strand:+ start:837 stop:1925 length:1089 start_codon:yes stop_codon:yes gene_type:complete
LKIAIGYRIKDSSWGGGNQFVSYLVKAALDRSYKVTFNLSEKDIDVILIIDPRSYNNDIPFGTLEILRYLLFVNKNAIVVHRINECDERKKTNHMNALLRLTNYFADYTVFISNWLRTLSIYDKNKDSSVILNGADTSIFRNHNNRIWDGVEPLKIVTHHWSSNYMKGFDVYKKLDNLLSNKSWKDKLKFTYIGNLPEGFSFKNSQQINPISGISLGRELSKHHIYISGSINEPAGMHHIEGILCGLPIIFRKSGALPEYCTNYGVSFENNNFQPALEIMIQNYSKYKEKILDYENNSVKMTNQYLDLFLSLIQRKNEIVKKRNLLRSPLLLILNFVFAFMKIKTFASLFRKSFLKKLNEYY